MCRPARLPRQVAVNLSRSIAEHQVDNRGRANQAHHASLPALFSECIRVFTQVLCAPFKVFPRWFSFNAHLLSFLGLLKHR